MQKRFFWAKQTVSRGLGADPDIFLHRFRNMVDRDAWMMTAEWAEVLSADDPEVRRIQRRMAKGEDVTFPFEVTA